MGTRNETMWGEIYDLPIFGDAENPEAAKLAWDAAEKLEKAGHMTYIDLLHLKTLIEVACSWKEEE